MGALGWKILLGRVGLNGIFVLVGKYGKIADLFMRLFECRDEVFGDFFLGKDIDCLLLRIMQNFRCV